MASKKNKRYNLNNKVKYNRWMPFLVVGIIAVIGVMFVLVSKASAPPKSVIEFGAIGDGITDDTVAIQTAIDTVSASGSSIKQAQELKVPSGTYKITKPLLMKSYVQLRGIPGQSIILQGSTNPGEKSHIILGDAHPWAFTPTNNYDAQGRRQTFTNMPAKFEPPSNKPKPTENVWPQGANTITLLNSADTARLQPGEIVCVRSKLGLAVGDYEQPDKVQFTRIESIDGNTLHFAERSVNKVEDPEVCKIEGRDPYISAVMGKDVQWYSIQSVEISGLTFRGGDLGFDRGLCYGCFIKQVNFENMTTPLAMNALIKNIFTDINAVYAGRAIEVKMASSHTLFKNINLRYKPVSCPAGNPNTDCTPQNFYGVWPVDVGERSDDIVFENLNVNDAKSKRYKAIFSVGDARNIRLKNSNMQIDGGVDREAVLELRGNYYIGDESQKFITENFVFQNNTFNLKSSNKQLALLGDRLKRTGPVFQIKNITFDNNKWYGLPTTTDIAYLARNQIKNWSVTNDNFNGVANKIVTESGSDPPEESGVKYNN